MIKKTLILLALAASMVPVNGQNDAAAMTLLDKVSAAAQSAPSVSMDLMVVNIDKASASTDTIEGTLVVKGDSYLLKIPGNEVWCNGKVVWSYVPDFNEVTITDPVNDPSSMLSSPSAIYTMYKEGYKVRLLNESSSRATIDLYPTDLKSEVIRIRIEILKTGNKIQKLEYATRSGMTIEINIKKYVLDFKPTDTYFTFDPVKYKGIEIIDMR